MKQILAGLITSVSLALLASPAMAATAHPIGNVNIRSGPGTQYDVIGVLADGDRLPVIGNDGTWLNVRTATGASGYVAGWVTREVFDDGPAYLQVDTDLLNIRLEPSVTAPVVGNVVQGDRLKLLEGLNGWYKVDIGALGTGWIKGEFTYRVTPPPATQPPPTPPPDLPPAEVPREAAPKEVVATAATAMYNGRATGYTVTGRVSVWERLTYLDSSEGWVKVAGSDGEEGWVDGRFLQMTDRGLPFAHQAIYRVQDGEWSATYLRVREVVPGGTGLALRAAPSAGAAVQQGLTAGQRVKLLQVPDGEFVEVMLEGGATGWVSRTWLKPVAGTPAEAVRLVRTAPGIFRLELTGQTARAVVSTVGTELKLALPENTLRRASLLVRQTGLAALSLGREGLVVRFDQAFSHRVVEQLDERTVIEIRPVLQQAEWLKGEDRQTLRFHFAGTVEPWARRDGGEVTVGLPGAILGTGVPLPDGVALEQSSTGLTARVPSGRPFAIKRGDGFVDLVLYAPGLAGKTIVIDPGHGGIESGAEGAAGLLEKEVNLAVALRLKPMLEAAGARVVMTRTADTRCASPTELSRLPEADHLRFDLNCRTVVANTSSADAFVSIHSNANPSRSLRGTETYWAGANLNAPQSRVLAGLVQQELVAALGLPDRGVLEDMFYVIKNTDAPAALAEVAFVSNTVEESLLKTEAVRQQTAGALFRALERFFQEVQ